MFTNHNPLLYDLDGLGLCDHCGSTNAPLTELPVKIISVPCGLFGRSDTDDRTPLGEADPRLYRLVCADRAACDDRVQLSDMLSSTDDPDIERWRQIDRYGREQHVDWLETPIGVESPRL